MVDLEDLHVLLSSCCSKAGAVLLSMLTRPIAGTQCRSRVNGVGESELEVLAGRSLQCQRASPCLCHGSCLPSRVFGVDICIINSCCQGMVTLSLCRAADALCSARSVRIAFFFPACIWKGTSGFVLLHAETFMPTDVAVDRDFFGVPPPLVLRHWECWREQTVSSACGKPKLEGCWGPGHRLPAGFASWHLARCFWQSADLEGKAVSGKDDVGYPKALLGYCVCGRMTPAVPAATFCSAAGNGSAKPWAGFC